MVELDPQITAEVVDYIKDEILAAIPAQINQLSSETVEVLRDKLHILRYYCSRKGFDPAITDRINASLETSQGLWELLDGNERTFMYLKEMYKIRWLDLGADLIGKFEEYSSGEDTIRDVIINTIATFMGWKSDTIWVDVAKIDYKEISETHTLRLREELWQFIDELSRNGDEVTLGKSIEIGEKMDALMRVLTSSDIPVPGRALLLSNIYILLIRLNIDRMLVAIKAQSKVA